MGRYEINKLMRRINMDADAHRRYVTDPVAYVAAWEELGRRSSTDPDPHPPGGCLTGAERDAFVERDGAALYAMGAHPYLLWSFTEAVWIHELPREEIVRRFKEAARRIGYPDATT